MAWGSQGQYGRVSVTHNEIEAHELTEKLRRVEYNLPESAKWKEAAKQKEAAALQASLAADDTQQANTKFQLKPNLEQEYNSLNKELDRLRTLKQKLTAEAKAQQRQIEKMKCWARKELRALQSEITKLDGSRSNISNRNAPPQPSANSNNTWSFDPSSHYPKPCNWHYGQVLTNQ